MTRVAIHKVGLLAAVLGTASLSALPFAVVRANRIAGGEPVALWGAVGAAGALALLGGWALLAALSLPGKRSWASLARGVVASALAVGTLAASGVAASRLVATAGEFGRVSIGGGAWGAIAAAWLAVVASRSEVASLRGARGLLRVLVPLGAAALLASGALNDTGIVREYANVSARFWQEASTHLGLAAVSVAVAMVAGVALGILAYRSARLERPILAAVSVVQTLPGLAMIGLLVAPLAALSFRIPALRALGIGGLGPAPVVVALTLYALLVIVHDTIVGLEGVASQTRDAASGMGMSAGQVLRRVELPLAAPVIYTGVRTASLQTVGNAVLGAFVAAGTLGLFITQGLAEGSPDLVLLGALAVVALALVLDAALRAAEPLLFRRARREGGAA